MIARFGTIWLFWLLGLGQSFAQNPYYDHGAFPSPGTLGSSAAMRAELDLIEAGFAKLPTLSGNANKVVVVNGSGTALMATDAPIASGTTFPASPSLNALFLILDDVAGGDCESAGGSVASLCRWNGSGWEAVSSASTVPGLTQVLAVDRVDGDATSQATAVKIGSAAASAYVVTYRDATDGLIHTCEVAGVLHDCNRVITLLAGRLLQIKKAGVVTWEIDSDGNLTEGAINVETAGVSLTLPFRWDLDLCGVSPVDGTTVAHVWNDDPLGATPTATARVGTNRGVCVLTFPDSDGQYGIQISRQLPEGFTGSFDADIWWDTTGTGNARFQIATKCYADDEADDAAFNAASLVTAAAGTSGRPNKQTLTGITTTGCAGGELMRIRFFRDRTEASDSLTAALNVEKIVLKGRATE